MDLETAQRKLNDYVNLFIDNRRCNMEETKTMKGISGFGFFANFNKGFSIGWKLGAKLKTAIFGFLLGIICGSIIMGGYVFNYYTTRIYTIPIFNKDKNYDMKFISYKGKIYMVIEKELP